MQLIDLIWLFVEHFYQTDQQQQEMGGLEIQLKTALPMYIWRNVDDDDDVFGLSRELLTQL